MQPTSKTSQDQINQVELEKIQEELTKLKLEVKTFGNPELRFRWEKIFIPLIVATASIFALLKTGIFDAQSKYIEAATIRLDLTRDTIQKAKDTLAKAKSSLDSFRINSQREKDSVNNRDKVLSKRLDETEKKYNQYLKDSSTNRLKQVAFLEAQIDILKDSCNWYTNRIRNLRNEVSFRQVTLDIIKRAHPDIDTRPTQE